MTAVLTTGFGAVDGARREDFLERDDFSFGNEREAHEARGSGGDVGKAAIGGGGKAGGADGGGLEGKVAMPPTSVMTRLILIMVWRKLIRNPNTYSSLIGLIWSLVSFRLGCLLHFTGPVPAVSPVKLRLQPARYAGGMWRCRPSSPSPSPYCRTRGSEWPCSAWVS